MGILGMSPSGLAAAVLQYEDGGEVEQGSCTPNRIYEPPNLPGAPGAPATVDVFTFPVQALVLH